VSTRKAAATHPGLVAFTGCFWLTMRFLLAGRIAWRVLLSSAAATAVFWLGMEAVYSVIFSGMVIFGNQKIRADRGVFCPDVLADRHRVVVILGAVTGAVWHERNLSFKAAFNKLRTRRTSPKAVKL